MPAKHDKDDEKPAHDDKPKAEGLLSALGLTDKPHDDDDKPDEKPKHKPEHKAATKAEAPPPEPCNRTIEDLLADPTFDPDGHVRLRLASLSVSGGTGQRPPLSLVTPDGMPVAEA